MYEVLTTMNESYTMELSISQLLRSVASVNESYERVLKATGEKFNIFRVLGVETDEVRLHSAFIAELLNPNGSHGQSDIFLKAFIKGLSIPGFVVDRNIIAEVIVEEYAGKVNIEPASGGRMDIVIKTKDKIIVIENKINAGDQNKQLVRYHNRYPNAHLIYLTLDGKDPEKYSVENSMACKLLEPDKDYWTASYEKDIINWLIVCRRHSVQHPLLRETISQYINLIKNLTGQTMSSEKQASIVNILTENSQNIKAAIEINGSIYEAKKSLLGQFAGKVKEIVSSQMDGLEIQVSPDFGDKYCGMEFRLLKGKINWLRLSFAGPHSWPYLEIYNDKNIDRSTGKVVKDPENIQYYKDQLNLKCATWGKIENVDRTWHGDWVCRYAKLNRFNDPSFWGNFANKDFSLADEVGNDIMSILRVLR